MPARHSAGGVVIGPEKKIALVEQHQHIWSLPKGGVESGESELDAARREIAEETGITMLEKLADLGSYERYSIGLHGEDKSLGLRRRTFFLFKTPQTEFKVRDAQEILGVRWVTLDEALALLTHPKDREFLASVRDTIATWL